MAFDLKRLSVLCYDGSFTLWHYRLAEDELGPALHVLGHFDRVADLLAVGDILMMSGVDGAGLLCVVGSGLQGVRLAALA